MSYALPIRRHKNIEESQRGVELSLEREYTSEKVTIGSILLLIGREINQIQIHTRKLLDPQFIYDTSERKRRNKIKQINKGDQKALELKQVLTVVCRIVVLGTFQTFRSQVRYEILYSALEQAVTLCQNVQLKYTWREILIKIP